MVVYSEVTEVMPADSVYSDDIRLLDDLTRLKLKVIQKVSVSSLIIMGIGCHKMQRVCSKIAGAATPAAFGLSCYYRNHGRS